MVRHLCPIFSTMPSWFESTSCVLLSRTFAILSAQDREGLAMRLGRLLRCRKDGFVGRWGAAQCDACFHGDEIGIRAGHVRARSRRAVNEESPTAPYPQAGGRGRGR